MGAAGANPGGTRLQYAPDAMRPRADGTHLRHRSISGLDWQTVVGQHFRRHPCERLAEKIPMWDEHNTRKPMLLLRLSGSLLLRLAERALSALLFQDPPRNTRATSQGAPQNCTLPHQYAPVNAVVVKQNRALLRGASVNITPAHQHTSRSAISGASGQLFDGDKHNTRKPISLARSSV